jgi:hypothetical protein
MTRKAAARTQHEPGAARKETEQRTGRSARPARKRKDLEPEATTPEPGPFNEAPGTGAPLPPPHPALVELVRLMARADARRMRSEERETRG